MLTPTIGDSFGDAGSSFFGGSAGAAGSSGTGRGKGTGLTKKRPIAIIVDTGLLMLLLKKIRQTNTEKVSLVKKKKGKKKVVRVVEKKEANRFLNRNSFLQVFSW